MLIKCIFVHIVLLLGDQIDINRPIATSRERFIPHSEHFRSSSRLTKLFLFIFGGIPYTYFTVRRPTKFKLYYPAAAPSRTRLNSVVMDQPDSRPLNASAHVAGSLAASMDDSVVVDKDFGTLKVLAGTSVDGISNSETDTTTDAAPGTVDTDHTTAGATPGALSTDSVSAALSAGSYNPMTTGATTIPGANPTNTTTDAALGTVDTDHTTAGATPGARSTVNVSAALSAGSSDPMTDGATTVPGADPTTTETSISTKNTKSLVAVVDGVLLPFKETTLVTLKTYLRNANLLLSGKKDELYDRVRQHLIASSESSTTTNVTTVNNNNMTQKFHRVGIKYLDNKVKKK